MKITERKLRQVIREAISRLSLDRSVLSLDSENCSKYSHSLAWISPEGEIYMLDGDESHNDFAAEIVEEKLKDPRNEEVWRPDGESPSDVLVRAGGWARVTNGAVFEMNTLPEYQKDEVLRAVFKIMIGCVNQQRFPSLYNPERETIILSVYPYRRVPQMTVAEFFSKYATDEEQEELYSALY